MTASEWVLLLLTAAGAAFYVLANKDSKIVIHDNTPAPKSIETITPVGVSSQQIAAIQSVVSATVPQFDFPSAVAVQFTDAEIRAIANMLIARANTHDNRLVLIGSPNATKFADKNGMLLYRLAFSVYDAADNAGSRLEAVVTNGPGELGTSVAHFRHAHSADEKTTVLPSEEQIGALPTQGTFEPPWDFAKRFAFPIDE